MLPTGLGRKARQSWDSSGRRIPLAWRAHGTRPQPGAVCAIDPTPMEADGTRCYSMDFAGAELAHTHSPSPRENGHRKGNGAAKHPGMAGDRPIRSAGASDQSKTGVTEVTCFYSQPPSRPLGGCGAVGRVLYVGAQSVSGCGGAVMEWFQLIPGSAEPFQLPHVMGLGTFPQHLRRLLCPSLCFLPFGAFVLL